jgi:hypothetical protein
VPLTVNFLGSLLVLPGLCWRVDTLHELLASAVPIAECNSTHLEELGEVMSTNKHWSTLKGLRRKMSLPLLVTGAHWSG